MSVAKWVDPNVIPITSSGDNRHIPVSILSVILKMSVGGVPWRSLKPKSTFRRARSPARD